MPNHITTVCTVSGPPADVAAFAERHVVPHEKDKERRVFDFATIIPQPAIVRETESGSEATIGVAALVGDMLMHDFRQYQWLPAGVLDGPGYRHAKQVRAWLEENRPKALEKGRKCLQAVAETGYPDWYEWSIANWGTKWGAYAYEDRERGDGRFVFKFETAWSFPEKVFRKLAEMWPTLTIAVVALDEGGNFGCDGEFNGKNDYRCEKDLGDDEVLYAKVYGRPKPQYDENGDEIEPAAPSEGAGEP